MDAQPPPALPLAPSTRETRRALRERLVALRCAQPETRIAAWSAGIRTHLVTAFPELAGLRVGFCWPIQNEPDLRPLLAEWRAAARPGFAALLPVVVAPATPLAFRAWDERTPLVEDRYGIPYPPEGEFVRVSVEDEGQGMTEEVRERVTEPFFTTRVTTGGTGLGLSICARIVQHHSGRMEIESQPGVGTQVSVWLPVATA